MSTALQRFEEAPEHDLTDASGSARIPILIGAAIIVLGLGGLLIWAALAPLSGAVHAGGKVTVESSRKSIQHLEGGIIAAINVEDRQPVAKGDILVRLDTTQQKARLAVSRAELDDALATRARLVAERDGLTRVATPPGLSARAALPDVQAILAVQRRQFEERRKNLAGRVDIYRKRIAQYGQQIDGLAASRDAAAKQIEIYRKELIGQRELNAKGFFPTTRILASEREVARLEGEEGANRAAIARAHDAIAEAELQIIQIKRQFSEDVVGKLAETEGKIRDLKERVVVAEDSLRRAVIRAPVTGTVQGLKAHTIGGVVAPGAELMQIVPGNDRLVVEAQVKPTDIDSVHDGLEAEVRFPAFRTRVTPSVLGKVTEVSADRIDDPTHGLSYYLARIEISNAELDKLGDKRLRAGMPAEVMIRTGERTALNYIIRPITDAMVRAFAAD